MSARAWREWSAHQLGTPRLWAGVVAAAVATVATLVVAGEELTTLATAVVFALGGLVAWLIPPRVTALALVLVLLGIDDYQNAMGLWHTPWAFLNQALVSSVDRVLPIGAPVKLQGLELVLAVVTALLVLRRHGVRAAPAPELPAPRVLRDATLLALAAIAFACANGLTRGGSGEIAVFQARAFVQTLLLSLAFQAVFTSSRDLALVGRVIVAAALLKAALAVYVVARWAPGGGALNTATCHGDSMLFAMACFIVVARFMERPDGRRAALVLLVVPPVLCGMIANNRRLAWVELGLALLLGLLVGTASAWRRTARALVVAVPLVTAYVAVGWSSTATAFAPVRMLRSLVDPARDASTLWREVENWNIARSMAERPLLGLGMGHEYTEYRRNWDISAIYPQYKAAPHNGLLGLLLFGGIVGGAAVLALYVVGFFLAARAYRFAADPELRAAALCSHATLLVALVGAYGDVGFYVTQTKVLVALALAWSGKLALATGAWPAPSARARLRPLPVRNPAPEP